MDVVIVRVVVDVALDREFDYLVPDVMKADITVGRRVVVPFGRRVIEGYVVGFVERTDIPNLKPLKGLAPGGAVLSPGLVSLARWMGEYYCAPFEKAVRSLLPGAVRRKGARHREVLVVRGMGDLARPPRNTGTPRSEFPHSPDSSEARGKACERSGSGEDCLAGPCGIPPGKAFAALPAASAEGRVETSDLRPPTSDLRPPLPGKLSPKQQAVMDAVRLDDGIRLSELTGRLGITAAPVRALEKKGLVSIEKEASRRDPFAGREVLRSGPLELMEEQAVALELIKRTLDQRKSEVGSRKSDEPTSDLRPPTSAPRKPHVVLLHGVTGSGKTEVYLQAIAHVLERGQGAIVLVPEIALTPQTVRRFRARFGDHIAVLHSHLSDGERHDEWHRIQRGDARIVVGARSAVFAPVSGLGLIVVDEEHEPSYKQEDAPCYNARDVAVMRGYFEGVPVVLGSATPSLESWMNVRKEKYLLASLTHRADHRQFPRVRVVDMRLKGTEDEKKKFRVLSYDLMEGIRGRLEKGEQTILFLNRRGFSSSIICKKCGHVAACDSCSVSLTYHRHDEHLHCHICGAQRGVPSKCPGCGDPEFKYSGVGTQRVEHVVNACFPKARVQRMDRDVTRRKDSYERILGDFRVGKIDILIGTQMIAKGLHFPNVTLVGVVYADLSLHIPDFRAGERTFQLLAQVAGRAGRGDVPGDVIVQTFTPSQPAVQAARRVDFEGFSDQELAFRKELNYPPFSHLVCIGLTGSHEEKTAFSAQTLATRLKPLLGERVIWGDAAPAPLAKAKGRYRFQIMLRCGSVKAMTGPIREALSKMDFPGDVRVSVDVDAMSLM
ncbi:MAG: primosomal protein N' [Verrucomicrobia bacterium]|jgi:primosomal protein N' (replication factor Y) (superfamily II helicase)|nr:primosomal protein N' [Verrucomicrobiota bacterium]MBT7066274.1 primosomal protein N' [Verrucomicrobiota bacterium]MBT7700914.1 primosomal protein N' [Verrucomicrobiota bacterium]